MNYEAEELCTKSRYLIIERSVDFKRVGCEGDEQYTFRDGSKITINSHWGWKQAYAPNGWNITPRSAA